MNESRRSKSKARSRPSGCWTIPVLFFTIVVEAVGVCTAAGSVWPIGVWIALTAVFVQMRVS